MNILKFIGLGSKKEQDEKLPNILLGLVNELKPLIAKKLFDEKKAVSIALMPDEENERANLKISIVCTRKNIIENEYNLPVTIEELANAEEIEKLNMNKILKLIGKAVNYKPDSNLIQKTTFETAESETENIDLEAELLKELKLISA
jgi:hypothetical protein